MANPLARIVSLAFVAAMCVAGAVLMQQSAGALVAVIAAIAASLPGLALIWFAEEFAATAAFSRGISKPSPPVLVSVFGWLFLFVFPALIFFGLR